MPVEIPLSCLLISENEPPMDWSHVEALLDGSIIDQRPINVTLLDAIMPPVGTRIYRITNGRHRYVAALIRGDETLTATIDQRA